MQQSRPHDYRKQALKKYWKGYDELSSEWKHSQLRATDLQSVQKEIDEQVEDNEYYEAHEELLVEDW